MLTEDSVGGVNGAFAKRQDGPVSLGRVALQPRALRIRRVRASRSAQPRMARLANTGGAKARRPSALSGRW